MVTTFPSQTISMGTNVLHIILTVCFLGTLFSLLIQSDCKLNTLLLTVLYVRFSNILASPFVRLCMNLANCFLFHYKENLMLSVLNFSDIVRIQI